MTANPDYYAALDITPQATPEEVARAYRMMMRAHHPDTRTSPGPGSPAATGTATDVHDIMDAYAVLKDPGRRAAYNRQQRTSLVHDEAEHGRKEGAGISRDAPPLIVGPVRWHRVQKRTKPPIGGRVVQERAPDRIATGPLPFLALILPTQVGPARTCGEHDERKDQ